MLLGNTKPKQFIPNFEKSEYDNWLDFLCEGGTDSQWKALISKNNWKFKNDDTKMFLQYQTELKPISDKYYSGMHQLNSDWSILYNSKNYSGKPGENFKKLCLKNIELYKRMIQIGNKYNLKSSVNVPAYKRLAMLYEKQERYDESILVCIEALRVGAYGDNMKGRLARMIKKSGREPNKEELDLLQ